MTIDEFLVANLPEGKSELVRGEVRLTPPAEAPHGRAATNLVVALSIYVKEHRLGWVFGDAVGYELVRFPQTVRIPDASFVRADRIPSDGVRQGLFSSRQTWQSKSSRPARRPPYSRKRSAITRLRVRDSSGSSIRCAERY